VPLLPRTCARGLHVVLVVLRRGGHVEHLVGAAKGLCAPLCARPADPQHWQSIMQHIQRWDAKPGHLEHQHLAGSLPVHCNGTKKNSFHCKNKIRSIAKKNSSCDEFQSHLCTNRIHAPLTVLRCCYRVGGGLRAGGPPRPRQHP